MPAEKRARSASAGASPAVARSPAAAAAAKAAEVKAAATPRAATPKKAATTPAKTPAKAATTPAKTPAKAATTPAKTPAKAATTPKSAKKAVATPAKTPAKATPSKKAASPAAQPKVDPDLPMTPDGVVYHLACKASDLADKIIFVGDPGRVEVVAAEFDKGSITFKGSHREINIITGTYKKVPVTVLSTGMGTDNIEIIINEIHALKEYDIAANKWQTDKERKPSQVHIIRVGTCGSPRPDVPVGTLAITRHAIGMDNTCRFYDAPAVNSSASVKALQAEVNKTGLGKIGAYTTKAHEDVVNSLVQTVEAFNAAAQKKKQQPQGFIVGATASGSGFYGCQGRAVGKFRGHLTVPRLVDELGAITFTVDAKTKATERVVNIEMENSAVCFLSNFLGYKAGTVCAIIARRAGDLREFASPEVAKSAIANAITIALQALIAVPSS